VRTDKEDASEKSLRHTTTFIPNIMFVWDATMLVPTRDEALHRHTMTTHQRQMKHCTTKQ
jgi:hypothetical protein